MRGLWTAGLVTFGMLVLAGCGLLDLFPSPIPTTTPPNDGGEDAAILRVTVEHEGCCYMEGDIDVIQLDGPTTAEWSVDGESEARVAPGQYTLTAFEQVCGGNCGNLAAPKHHCTIDPSLPEGEAAEVRITFPVPGPCTAEVADDS